MAFSGTVTSDFLKLIPNKIEDLEKLIDYSASDFNSFRDALIRYIKATFPLDYTNFSESDFGMFLVELMAAVGHIQSFKSDYLANESFLRTARSKSSVKKLLELVGVRMKGPISAAANAVVTVQSDVPSFSSVTIPIQSRVVTIESPEDGSQVTYTLYKVKTNGSVDLDSNSNDLVFTVSSLAGNAIISNAVLLEGALVEESGVFQSPDVIKTVTLSQFPYVEGSAQVSVSGNVSTEGVYTEEENIYFASGPTDKVFQITTTDDFVATVVFGDSSIGQSPAIGDTYRITYRVGGGSRGNIAKEILNAPISVLTSNGTTTETVTATLENSGPATGGADAESIKNAKRYAPLTFRMQDRLVTLTDYKAFVNSFISSYGSTGKANAIVRRAYSSANIIDIFTLEKASNTQLRKATPEYKYQLLQAIAEKKMLTDEPVILDGLIRTLDIVTTVTLDKKYQPLESVIKSKVKDKVLEYFNIDSLDFGIEFIPQDLVRAIIGITEVRFATIDNVDNSIKMEFNEIYCLNNLTINIAYI
jgi:hypothetical protein